MNKFGRLKVFTLFAILFNFNDIAFSSVSVPAKPTYEFKVNGHEYNVVGTSFKYVATVSPLSRISLNTIDFKDYLMSTGNGCFKELGKLISKQGAITSPSRLLNLKQHMLSHGHMGYYPVFSSREGIVSSLQPRGIFNINLECKKRIAYDQIRKLNDMYATLQRDSVQSAIIDLPNLRLNIMGNFILFVPRDYPTLDPLFKRNGSVMSI